MVLTSTSISDYMLGINGRSVATSLMVALGTSFFLFLVKITQARIQQVRRWIHYMDLLPGVSPREHDHPWLNDLGLILNCPNTPHREAADQVKDTLPLLQAKAEEYGEQGLFKLWILNPYRLPFMTRPLVFMNDPVLIPQVLGSKAFGKFDRGFLFTVAAPLVGDSFLAAPDGDTWKHQRRLVQSGFSQTSLTETTRATTDVIEKDLIPAWDNYCCSKNDRPISVLPWMKRMAIDVLGRVAFSYSFGGVASFAHAAENTKLSGNDVSLYESFMVISTEITKSVQNPVYKLLPNRKYDNACLALNKTISDIVDLRFKLLEQSKISDSPLPTDLLSYLVQTDETTGKVLDKKAIVGNIRMFLFAGQDTTASCLSFCLWYIAKHETVQARLYDEINDLMSTKGEGLLLDADLRKLPYLHAVLKEALRLSAPAAVARETLQDVTVTNAHGKSYVLPKGVQVYITPFILQRSPRYWPDRPSEFIPERHLKEKKTNSLESGASEKPFIPFSLGPRNCIGQHLAMTEMRAAIALIVYRYKLRPAPTAIEPCPTSTMTVNPHEVLVTLSRRDA